LLNFTFVNLWRNAHRVLPLNSSLSLIAQPCPKTATAKREGRDKKIQESPPGGGDNEQSGRAKITLSAGGSAVLPSILRLLPIIFLARITVFILPRKVAHSDNLPQGNPSNKPFDSRYLSLLCDEIIKC
jgi:hypothetical protein